MQIDPAAEDLGREAVRTVVARDPEGLITAIEMITQADPALRDQVLPIYSAVGRSALRNVYENGHPNQQQNLDMARRIQEKEPWTPLEVRELWEILEGLASDEHTPQVPPEHFAAALFVVVGYLLAHYARTSGFATFYEYLDDILNGLVAQQG
jgi:hypothetical protein